MKTKAAIALYTHRTGSITGGHIYEQKLYNVISESEKMTIEVKTIPVGNSVISKVLYGIKAITLMKLLKNYDVIFMNSSKFFYWILLSILIRLFLPKKQLVIIHHHFLFLEFKGLRRIYTYIGEHLFLLISSSILVPSPYIKHLLETKFKNKRLLYIPIPFDKVQIVNNPNKVTAGKLLYIGTIEKRKGLIHLINALTYLYPTSYSLTIIGKTIDTEYYNMIANKIAKMNLNVTFTGFISESEKDFIVRTSDIFVFPSLLEGYGMAVMEAMGYGLPVICFNNSSMPYLINNGENGFMVRTGDEKELAEKIQLLISNRDLRSKMSNQAEDCYAKAYDYTDFKQAIMNNLID